MELPNPKYNQQKQNGTKYNLSNQQIFFKKTTSPDNHIKLLFNFIPQHQNLATNVTQAPTKTKTPFGLDLAPETDNKKL